MADTIDIIKNAINQRPLDIKDSVDDVLKDKISSLDNIVKYEPRKHC